MPSESVHHHLQPSYYDGVTPSDEQRALPSCRPGASDAQQRTSELMQELQSLGRVPGILHPGDRAPSSFGHRIARGDLDGGDEAVQRLPHEIENLLKVIDSTGFKLPSWLEKVAQAHGLGGLKFPCQAIYKFISMSATCVELQQRLGTLQEAQSNLIISNTRTIMHGARYYMVYCIAQNVYIALSHLQAAYKDGPEAALIPLAGQITAGFIHAQVYSDLTVVAKALGPRRDPAARDFSHIITDPAQRARIQMKINELMSQCVSGVPEVVISFLNYMLASQWVSQPRPGEANAN